MVLVARKLSIAAAPPLPHAQPAAPGAKGFYFRQDPVFREFAKLARAVPRNLPVAEKIKTLWEIANQLNARIDDDLPDGDVEFRENAAFGRRLLQDALRTTSSLLDVMDDSGEQQLNGNTIAMRTYEGRSAFDSLAPHLQVQLGAMIGPLERQPFGVRLSPAQEREVAQIIDGREHHEYLTRDELVMLRQMTHPETGTFNCYTNQKLLHAYTGTDALAIHVNGPIRHYDIALNKLARIQECCSQGDFYKGIILDPVLSRQLEHHLSSGSSFPLPCATSGVMTPDQSFVNKHVAYGGQLVIKNARSVNLQPYQHRAHPHMTEHALPAGTRLRVVSKSEVSASGRAIEQYELDGGPPADPRV
jgi:hypothetical protein